MIHKVRRILGMLGVGLAVLAALYLLAIYSNIPFVTKWRTIYIETAMSTYRHQWLATTFIPKNIIDRVLADKADQNKKIDELVNKWKDIKVFNPEDRPENDVETVEDEETKFLSKFWEIDKTTFDEYINNNPELIANGYDNLMINHTKIGDVGTTIKTIMGEQIMAIDAENNILIIKVHTSDYDGRLAIIKDPAQVKLGTASTFGEVGQYVGKIVEDNGAILGVNASGFVDPEWNGNGGDVMGLVIKDGITMNKALGQHQLMIGFDLDNNLRIGQYEDTSMFRDAVEFRPPLILNGEKCVEGTAGWGVQPRTAIGQDATGAVLILVIDGRQIGHSIGATMEQCADIMAQHNAVQASAVDGGSSSVMVYQGVEITKPPLKSAKGRHVPDAFIVMPGTN